MVSWSTGEGYERNASMPLEEYSLSSSFNPPSPIQVGDHTQREFLAVSRAQVGCVVASALAQDKQTQPAKHVCAAKQVRPPHQDKKTTYLRQPPQRGAGQRQQRRRPPSLPVRRAGGVVAGLRPPAGREVLPAAGRHRGRRAAGAGLLERRCTCLGWLWVGIALTSSPLLPWF